ARHLAAAEEDQGQPERPHRRQQRAGACRYGQDLSLSGRGRSGAVRGGRGCCRQEGGQMTMRLPLLRRASSLLLLLLLCGLLSACGGSRGDLEKWVAEVKAKPAPPLEPIPVMQQFET